MKKLIYIFAILLFMSIMVEAKQTLKQQTANATKSVKKPKKRFISEWRKEQWRKERLAKAKKSQKIKSCSKKTTTKKKKYVSEWRKAQWRKAALKKAKLNKKSISKWEKSTKKKRVIKKKRVVKKKIIKKRTAKRLNQYQVRKLNKIYKKVSKKTNINKRALKKAFSYYKHNKFKKSLSSKYLAIADYTKRARDKRLYIINLKNGAVYKHKVAHGKYSGSIGGKVRRSSNRRNSQMTPYGFFKVGSKVGRTKKKGYKYLSVKGLERSNRKVGYPSRYGGRDIVVHPARYVNRGGRSHGCFAICPKDRNRIFTKLKKALLYSYTGR